MRRLIIALAVAAIATSASGCASKPPEIALSSSDFDLNPLVGEWRGDYSNPEIGRGGTIAFTLRAGESAASGNIVMIPNSGDFVKHAAATGPVLTIHFIRKEGRKVTGTLDPYRDPACDCQANTTFEGAFTDGRTIEGTFTTVPSLAGRSATHGKWKVTRVKKL